MTGLSLPVRFEADLSYVANILKLLRCPLFRNGEDWWLKELLFVPGNHRYQLFEWFFKMLGFWSTLSNESNTEKDAPECLKVLIAMGICERSSLNLIQGAAPRTEQLCFWKRLSNMVWINEVIQPTFSLAACNSDDHDKARGRSDELQNDSGLPCLEHDVTDNGHPLNGQCSVSEKEKQEDSNVQARSNCLETEYLKCTSIVSNIASRVNIDDLFPDKISLFPPDIEKDIVHVLSTNKKFLENLSDLKSEVHAADDDSIPLTCSLNSSSGLSALSVTEDVETIEEEKRAAALEFVASEEEFRNTYNTLKPILTNSKLSFSDVGPRFEQINKEMEQFTKLMAYIHTMKSLSSGLQDKVNALGNFKFADTGISGSTLEQYIAILEIAGKQT